MCRERSEDYTCELSSTRKYWAVNVSGFACTKSRSCGGGQGTGSNDEELRNGSLCCGDGYLAASLLLPELASYEQDGPWNVLIRVYNIKSRLFHGGG